MAEKLNQISAKHREAFEAHHVNPRHEVGLGRGVVGLRLRASEDEADQHHVEAAIQRTRNQLESFSAEQQEIADTLMSHSSSPFFDKIMGIEFDEEGRGNYIERLTATDKTTGEYKVSSRVAANMFEKHNASLAEGQRELNERREEIIADFRHNFEEAVEDGWIPESALGSLDERLAKVEFILDDGLLTSLDGDEAFMLEKNGAGESTFEIFIPPEHAAKAGTVVTHELMHVMEGRGEPSPGEFETGAYQPRHNIGLKRVFGTEAGTLINEAVTEVLARIVAIGREGRKGKDVSEIILDSVDRSEGGIRALERSALQFLATNGDPPPGLRLFIDAYLENEDNAGEKPAGERLIKAIDEGFSAGFEGVKKAIADQAEKIAAARVDANTNS